MATNSSQTVLALQSAAAVTNAAGSFASASRARSAANANAAYADLQARDATERGNRSSQEADRKTRALISKQRASMAANGVALDEGSPLAVLESSQIMGEADSQTIKDNAARESYGYKMRGYNARAEASANNPYLAAGTSLIGSAGSVADKWYSYKKAKG